MLLTHNTKMHLVVHKGNVDQKAGEYEEGGIQVLYLGFLGYRSHDEKYGTKQHEICNPDWNLNM